MKEPASLSERIDHILQRFDKLDNFRVGTDNNIERREQNIEVIRKLLQREAFFIDEERKQMKIQPNHVD